MCILSISSESCFYTSGRIDWVGWRLARGEDGRGWSTRVPQEISPLPPFLLQNDCDTDGLLFDHHQL